MKELTIKVLGTVPYVTAWETKRNPEQYSEGEGLYVQVQNGQVIGLISVYDFNTDAPTPNCQFQEFLFHYTTIADIVVRDREDNLKGFLADSFEKVLKEIFDKSTCIENAFAEVNENVKRISENSGSTKGITEKTLLSALSIVTKCGTDNGEVK